MRLIARSDLTLLGGLAVSLYVGFSSRIEQLLDRFYELDQKRSLQLRPALVILVGVFIFHLLRKRKEMDLVAHVASVRVEEMQRLIAFSRAVSQSLDLDAINAAI